MKHTLHKTLAVLPLAAACAVFGTSAQAQQITFNGKVADVSCTITAPSGGTVTLPLVTPTDFASNVAGETTFSFGLSSCGSNSGIFAKMYFYGDSASVSNDRLNLLTGSTGSGWQYELLPAGTGTTPLQVGTTATVIPSAADGGVDLGTGAPVQLSYRVRYYSNDVSNISPGTGTSQATYVLYYN